MSSGKNILLEFKKKWQALQTLELFIYALGPALLCYFSTSKILAAVLVFGLILLTGFAIKKPWQLTLEKIGNYIDRSLDSAEYSTGLLLLPENQLSSLANLQRYQVSEELEKNITQL